MPTKKPVSTDRYYVPSKAFVQGVSVSDIGVMTFVSGVTARRQDGTIEGVGDAARQTRRVLHNLEAVLESSGGQLSDLVHTVTYLTDMSALDQVQAVKEEILGDIACASTTVEVSRLVNSDQLVEMEAIAVIG